MANFGSILYVMGLIYFSAKYGLTAGLAWGVGYPIVILALVALGWGLLLVVGVAMGARK